MSELSPIEVNIIPDSAVELADEIYKDGAKQTIVEVGKISGRIPRLINAILLDLDKWILYKEYNYRETQILLEQKLQNIDSDKISQPDTYVAVPALQAISYSMDSKELRNLYANLLAKSMYDDTKSFVHPSFVEIIKQLSPIDARIFSLIFNKTVLATVDLHAKSGSKEDGFNLVARNITGIDIANHSILSAAIDNLDKQGLIKVADEILVDDSKYSSIIKSNEYKVLYAELSKPWLTLEPNKKLIRITDLGNLFSQICVEDSITDMLNA